MKTNGERRKFLDMINCIENIQYTVHEEGNTYVYYRRSVQISQSKFRLEHTSLIVRDCRRRA